MRSMLLVAALAATMLAGCTDPATPEYTTPSMDDQERYVIPVGPDGQNIFGIKYAKVPVGSTVVWVSDGGAEPHNVKSDDGLFESTISADPWEFEYTFTDAGTFAYHCLPHVGVGMTGEVLVE